MDSIVTKSTHKRFHSRVDDCDKEGRDREPSFGIHPVEVTDWSASVGSTRERSSGVTYS